uniref:Uncharacterized protein n=1 Tax=Candidatus Kentrum sp. TUN TaxID=2126343 RepID=A0A451A3U1_9GAMM|nr:MAG: hypothetical protein BECKTUN1418F_GA0071002_106014 [Candidatus Kentron sp. TUN]VFK60698.1 MAG: hypothetical protein BECKTUN1418E_GA0071001_105914 [Candidatus Kentron sp. TUN]
MDENEYRNTYRAVNPFACPFQKAVLARQCGCEYLLHLHIAEREGAGCNMPLAYKTCVKLLDLLRQNARFSLKLVSSSTGSLPHGKEIKVQVGGLRGLAQAVSQKDPLHRIENIHALVKNAMEIYGEMENFPYQEIVKEIVRYEGRLRRNRSR